MPDVFNANKTWHIHWTFKTDYCSCAIHWFFIVCSDQVRWNIAFMLAIIQTTTQLKHWHLRVLNRFETVCLTQVYVEKHCLMGLNIYLLFWLFERIFYDISFKTVTLVNWDHIATKIKDSNCVLYMFNTGC